LSVLTPAPRNYVVQERCQSVSNASARMSSVAKQHSNLSAESHN
jgi:hypothetical protein